MHILLFPPLVFLLLLLLSLVLFFFFAIRTVLGAYLAYNNPHIRLIPPCPPTPHSLHPSLHWLLGNGDWGTLTPYRNVTTSAVTSALLLGRVKAGGIFTSRNLFGRPCVFVFDLDAVRRILFRTPYRYSKLPLTVKLLRPLIGRQGLVLADGDLHKRLKLKLAPAMHFEAVAMFSAVFLEEAVRLRELFRTAEGGVLPLRVGTGAATCRTILRSFFPEKSLTEATMALLTEKYAKVLLQLGRVVRDAILQNTFFFLPAEWFSTNAGDKAVIRRKTAEMLVDAKRDAAAVRCGGEERPSSMVGYFLREKGLQLTVQQQVDNLLTFLAAGQSTTAFSIVYALWRIGKHHDWQARVQEELDACPAWRDGTVPPADRVEAVCQLPCLQRVIKEALRMYPPIMFTSRMAVECDTLVGYEIPPGTSVFVSIMGIHYDPTHWENPHEFNPDRFLPEAEAGRDTMAWIPFLYGPRGCIGQRFALREMTVLIAEVVYSFELKSDPNVPDPDPCTAGIAGFPEVKVFASVRNA